MGIGILALGLFSLSLVGFADGTVAVWLPALDLAAASAAMVVAFVSKPRAVSVTTDLKGAVALSLVLVAAWVAALVTQMPGWITWLNFAFAFAYFFVSMGIAERKQRAWDGATTDEVLDELADQRRDRWSA